MQVKILVTDTGLVEEIENIIQFLRDKNLTEKKFGDVSKGLTVSKSLQFLLKFKKLIISCEADRFADALYLDENEYATFDGVRNDYNAELATAIYSNLI